MNLNHYQFQSNVKLSICNHAGVTMSLLTKSFNDDVLYPIILRLVIHSLILLRDLSDSLAGDLNTQILIYTSSSTTTTNPGHHKSRKTYILFI
jgi:hypothetical protein